jgi:hypothetical protein
MATTTWRVLRALSGLENGRDCRRCGESILSSDPFGTSEGVCGPCRLRSDT